MRNLTISKALVLLLWLTAAIAAPVQAQQNQLLGVRMWPAPDMTRLVFDISAPIQHKLFTLPKPARVVVDLKNVKKGFTISGLDYTKGFVKDIRTASKDGGKIRVLFLI